MVVYVYCKYLSLMFHLFFYTYVVSVSDPFYMLQVLHLDVSKIDRDVAHVAMVFQLYVPIVLFVLDVCYKCFICMLQKWIEVLHDTAGGCRCAGCRSLRSMRARMLGAGCRMLGRETGCGCGSSTRVGDASRRDVLSGHSASRCTIFFSSKGIMATAFISLILSLVQIFLPPSTLGSRMGKLFNVG
jgi:hypothetical protein